MEAPVSLTPDDVRREKTKLLRCIPPIKMEDTVIGQVQHGAFVLQHTVRCCAVLWGGCVFFGGGGRAAGNHSDALLFTAAISCERGAGHRVPPDWPAATSFVRAA